MGQLNAIADYGWVAFFVAGLLVKMSPRGSISLALGLIGLGVNGAIWWLARNEILDITIIQSYEGITLFVYVGSCALVLIGAIMMLGGKTMVASATQQVMQDAQGARLESLFTPRNSTNTFSRAENLRDEVGARLVARAARSGIRYVEQRSQAHSPRVWYRIDYMLPSPSPELHLCASVSIEIERFDFHRFEHTFTVTAQVGTQVVKIDKIIALDDSTADKIHQFIVSPGTKLKLSNRIRQWPLQFWRPQNKVKRLRGDWISVAIIVGSIVLLFIPFLGPFLTVGGVIALYIRNRRRRTYVLSSGKPLTDPRLLRWMDSWQASVFGLGSLAEVVQNGIYDRLISGELKDARIGSERIGYWGTDSWVERQQIVVCHRRAIGFIHVVPYGDVLYVAWEAHLNSASWVEEQLTAGIDRVSGLDVVANRVVAGWHRLNEYDVSDSNFLAEWMHEVVKREVKLRMAEHRIDQEIDFTVQHESRTSALTGSGETVGNKDKAENPLTKRFRRIG